MYVGKILMLSEALYGAQKLPSEPTDRMHKPRLQVSFVFGPVSTGSNNGVNNKFARTLVSSRYYIMILSVFSVNRHKCVFF